MTLIHRKQSCDHAGCRGSTICRHGTRLRRKQPPRTRTALPKRNPERRDREWARAYGSEARVEFVKSLPCCVPGCRNRAENAHTESGGMGRKADADTIAPLCYRHHRAEYRDSLHDLGSVAAFNERWGVDLEAEARRVEQLWRART